MSDKKSGKVTIVFKEDLLKSIPKVITKVGLPRFFREIIETVPQFIPQDTQTLVNSHYTDIDEEKLIGIVGYGSKYSPDYEINDIAIKQHEEVLNHYGMPGKSMRLGVMGANIPGKKYVMLTGQSYIRDAVLGKQQDDYWKGYQEKKEAGQLSPYPTKFLEKAIYKVVNTNLQKHFNEDVIMEPLIKEDRKRGKRKSDNLPRGVL